jgi:hypothetical protein
MICRFGCSPSLRQAFPCGVVYGVVQGDYVIIIANAASLVMLAGIIYFKTRGSRETAR